ncbi:MAG: hypothetical protein ACYCT1_15330 [Steroidobacteraceae bacterium]
MNPVTSFLVSAFIAAAVAVGYFVNLYVALALVAGAVFIAASLKMANVWQNFVILRLGKLQSVRGGAGLGGALGAAHPPRTVAFRKAAHVALKRLAGIARRRAGNAK